MASRMLFTASARVLPCEIHPGKVGASAMNTPSSSFVMRTRNFIARLYAEITYSMPNSFHRRVTCSFVLLSMVISSGQGRVKPSFAHLRVPSIPILDPKFG